MLQLLEARLSSWKKRNRHASGFWYSLFKLESEGTVLRIHSHTHRKSHLNSEAENRIKRCPIALFLHYYSPFKEQPKNCARNFFQGFLTFQIWQNFIFYFFLFYFYLFIFNFILFLNFT